LRKHFTIDDGAEYLENWAMSRLPFELLFTLRYMRPKRTFVSIITLISVIGVTLGVAVLIIVLSVMSGFDLQLKSKIMGFNAHLRIFEPGYKLSNYEPIMNIVATNAEVKGVAPLVIGPVLLETQPIEGGSQVMAPWIRGLAPKLESKISILPSSIVRGEFSVSGKGILIGIELARKLHLEVGDNVLIHSPSNLKKMWDCLKAGEQEGISPTEFTVRGIFDVGYYEYNASVVFCSLLNAQDLYDLNEDIHGLIVMLKDPMKVNQVRDQLSKALGDKLEISTWAEENSGMLNALLVEKNVMFYILFFIMIVAAFGITSVLITFVVQKTREIGMLKALGATSGQVMWIFLCQSIFVGVIGVVCGLGLGMLAISYRNEFLHFMNRMTGFELFPSDIYTFSELPARIIPHDIMLICGGSLIICILAGVLPAWNAGRLKPVDALRYE
jgi:lipoprotein-releasing system permease protein